MRGHRLHFGRPWPSTSDGSGPPILYIWRFVFDLFSGDMAREQINSVVLESPGRARLAFAHEVRAEVLALAAEHRVLVLQMVHLVSQRPMSFPTSPLSARLIPLLGWCARALRRG